jgi:hypothetical protein
MEGQLESHTWLAAVVTAGHFELFHSLSTEILKFLLGNPVFLRSREVKMASSKPPNLNRKIGCALHSPGVTQQHSSFGEQHETSESFVSPQRKQKKKHDFFTKFTK